MKAYEEIIHWAIRSVRGGYTFPDTAVVSRKTTLSRMQTHLNSDQLISKWENMYLPYSKVYANVAYFSARAVFTDLLSCQVLNNDENCIFNGDYNTDRNPYAIQNGRMIGDINTGCCNLETHKKLCTSPNDMLLPCPLVIDGAHHSPIWFDEAQYQKEAFGHACAWLYHPFA